MRKDISEMSVAFFGTPEFAVTVLDELEQLGIVPRIVITQPDKPAGRKMLLTPPPVKKWAESNHIEIVQPEKLDKTFAEAYELLDIDIAIVAAYGLIVPKQVLGIPRLQTINIHPSLLPQWRGASPLQAALLNDNLTGVTIMLMDEKMDHGPILDQELTATDTWPIPLDELQELTARQGAHMIARLLPDLLNGNIDSQEQDHAAATFTQKIVKADAELDLSADGELNYRKYCAYTGWPRVFFFDENNKRVIVSSATLSDGEFIIQKVIPEGKKEIQYDTFQKQST